MIHRQPPAGTDAEDLSCSDFAVAPPSRNYKTEVCTGPSARCHWNYSLGLGRRVRQVDQTHGALFQALARDPPDDAKGEFQRAILKTPMKMMSESVTAKVSCGSDLNPKYCSRHYLWSSHKSEFYCCTF